MKSVNDRRGVFIFIFILATGLTIFLSGVWKSPTREPNQEKLETNVLSIVHSIGLNDLDLINKAYSEDKEFIIKPTGKVLGGIVPHHYSIAASVIAGFYEGISSQQVEAVIILGPDHFNLASHPIVTSLGSFSTLFGTIMPENDFIIKLLGSPGVSVDEIPFEREHSIYSQLPFIKKTFPDAKIVPLIINVSATKEDADKLADAISKNIKGNMLVLASVDFVHYLSSEEADRLDKESIIAFETLNPEKILGLTDQLNLDCEIGVYALFKIVKTLGATKAQLVANTNSGKLATPPFTEKVVSYVSMYFIGGEKQ
jgi:hypothetical protein